MQAGVLMLYDCQMSVWQLQVDPMQTTYRIKNN